MIKRMLLLGFGLLLILDAFASASAKRLDTPAPVSKIAYVSADPDKEAGLLITVNPDGSNPVTLVKDGDIEFPAWSPDGTQLAFTGGISDNGRYSRYDTYVINSDGTNLHKVSAHHSLSYPGQATWSPDGKQLIYSAWSGYTNVLYIVNADGTNDQPFHFDSTISVVRTFVRWSPDGSQLAVSGESSKDPSNYLYVGDGSGQHAQQFPAYKDGDVTFDEMAWSADGKRVLLYTVASMTEPPEEIALVDPNGSHLTRVVKPVVNTLIVYAALSPDSKQIVFAANEPNVDFEPAEALWIVNSDGSQLHALPLKGISGASGLSWGLVPASTPAEPASLARLGK